MKRYLLPAILFSAFSTTLLSCKLDPPIYPEQFKSTGTASGTSTSPVIETIQLTGIWKVSSSVTEFLNTSYTLVAGTAKTDNNGLVLAEIDNSDGIAVITPALGSEKNVSYTISTSNGKTYMILVRRFMPPVILRWYK